MNRTLVFTGFFMLIAAAGTAQPANVDADPGVIGPDHPLYNTEIILDTSLVNAGVKPPGDVVHERASEALIATEANDSQARDRALAEMNRVAQVATGDEEQALGKAEAVLQEVKDRTPDEAAAGVDTAIESVIAAQNRFPTDPVPDQVPDLTDVGGRPDTADAGGGAP